MSSGRPRRAEVKFGVNSYVEWQLGVRHSWGHVLRDCKEFPFEPTIRNMCVYYSVLRIWPNSFIRYMHWVATWRDNNLTWGEKRAWL